MQQKNASPKTPSSRATAPTDAPEGALRPLPGLRYGVLDDLMGYALRRAQNALYLHFQQAVPQAELSPQRFAALALVVENPGLRQGLLAQAMGLHRSGGLRLADWLCAQGWVARRDDALDGRSWTLHPTPDGLVALAQLSAAVQAHDQALLAALGPEGAALQPLLERLIAVAAGGGAGAGAGG